MKTSHFTESQIINIFAISQTCYRYKAKLSEDNERVTDW